MSLNNKLIKAALIVSIVFAGACNTNTPDYSHTENEGSSPDANRRSDDSTHYNESGRLDNSTMDTSVNSQKANDSLSGSRVAKDINKSLPSKELQQSNQGH